MSLGLAVLSQMWPNVLQTCLPMSMGTHAACSPCKEQLRPMHFGHELSRSKELGSADASMNTRHKIDPNTLAGGEAAGAVLSPVVKSEVADEEQGEDPLMAYPERGYWALAPGCRLRMLRALCCDALDTAIIRCPYDYFPCCSAQRHLQQKYCPYWGDSNLLSKRKELSMMLSWDATEVPPCQRRICDVAAASMILCPVCARGGPLRQEGMRRQKMDDSFDAAAAEEKRAREKAAAARRSAPLLVHSHECTLSELRPAYGRIGAAAHEIPLFGDCHF